MICWAIPNSPGLASIPSPKIKALYGHPVEMKKYVTSFNLSTTLFDIHTGTHDHPRHLFG